MIETGEDLKDARIALGLSFEQMRVRLRLGARGAEYIRRMESDRVDVSGPVAVAVGYMLREAGLVEP